MENTIHFQAQIMSSLHCKISNSQNVITMSSKKLNFDLHIFQGAPVFINEKQYG